MGLGSDVAKMHVLRTWLEGQWVCYGRPSIWMNGVQVPVTSETDHIRSLGRHARLHTHHKGDFRTLMAAAHCVVFRAVPGVNNVIIGVVRKRPHY